MTEYDFILLAMYLFAAGVFFYAGYKVGRISAWKEAHKMLKDLQWN